MESVAIHFKITEIKKVKEIMTVIKVLGFVIVIALGFGMKL